MNRQTARAVQAEVTKKKIYEASVRLIKEKGYGNVSIEEICKVCGITRGAFYHHFHSKEGIIREISMGFDYNIKEFYENELINQNSQTKIRRIMEYYLSFIADMGVDLMRQLNKTMLDGKNSQLLSMERYAAKILFHSVQDGKMNGELRGDLSIDNISFALHSFTIGIAIDWCSNNGSYNLVEVGRKSIDELITLFKKA